MLNGSSSTETITNDFDELDSKIYSHIPNTRSTRDYHYTLNTEKCESEVRDNADLIRLEKHESTKRVLVMIEVSKEKGWPPSRRHYYVMLHQPRRKKTTTIKLTLAAIPDARKEKRQSFRAMSQYFFRFSK